MCDSHTFLLKIKKMDNSKIINRLYSSIINIVKEDRANLAIKIHQQVLFTYWKVGRLIVNLEQKKSTDKTNMTTIILELSKLLTQSLGRGFSRSNMTYMRLFYIYYPNGVSNDTKLRWSHYYEILKLEDDLERSFYEKQAQLENWSVRELRRQRNTSLFQRLALSKDKAGILKLAQEGRIIETEQDILHSPYVLEFLNLPEPKFSEKELEAKIIKHLQYFLLELGKGFAFIASQYRITINNKHYHADLVFYHVVLKCYVLIDLKLGEVQHYDIGQMNMYLSYFETEVSVENDNMPIGIILTQSKDEIMVEYATRGLENKLFVSKYQTYLPNKEQLAAQVRQVLEHSEED